MASKGGPAEKIWCVKRGHQKMALKLSSDSVCNNANNSARRPKKKRFYGSENSNFPGGECSRTPLHYYTPNGNSTSPTVSLQNTARGM